MARIHENRFGLETEFAGNLPSISHLTQMFMMLFGKFEKFAGIDLNMELWFLDAAPWQIDFFLLSLPLNIDASEIVGSASEAAAITALNAQIDLTDINEVAQLHLSNIGQATGEQLSFPTATLGADDIRTEFDKVLPFKLHAQLKCVVPILHMSSDAGVFKTFGRKQIRWNQRMDYTYNRPSVLVLYARQFSTSTDLSGPWSAGGVAQLDEAQWRYLLRPAYRGAENVDTGLVTSNISVKVPFVIPQTSKFEGLASKLLNCAGTCSIFTETNHPLANTLL